MSVIKTNEMIEMTDFIYKNYDEKNLVEFNSIMSYYQLVTIQVFFESNRIIFAIHFPLVRETDYQMHQIVPIPQNTLIAIPSSLFIFENVPEILAIERECPVSLAYLPECQH